MVEDFSFDPRFYTDEWTLEKKALALEEWSKRQLGGRPHNYILDENKNPIPEWNILKWAKWFENADRHIAKTEIDTTFISTVFLGVDHSFDHNGPPLLFETMVFLDGQSMEMERYTTWKQAEEGHKQMVALVTSQAYKDKAHCWAIHQLRKYRGRGKKYGR